jgi:hypothetical protein
MRAARLLGRTLGFLVLSAISGVIGVVAFLYAGGGHELSETIVRLRIAASHGFDAPTLTFALGGNLLGVVAGDVLGKPSRLRWLAGWSFSLGLMLALIATYYATDERFSAHEHWGTMFAAAIVPLAVGKVLAIMTLVARWRAPDSTASAAPQVAR